MEVKVNLTTIIKVVIIIIAIICAYYLFYKSANDSVIYNCESNTKATGFKPLKDNKSLDSMIQYFMKLQDEAYNTAM